MTGGRFNEKGRLALKDDDKVQALKWMAETMAPRTMVQIQEAMKPNWSQDFALHRPIIGMAGPPYYGGPAEQRYFVADLTFLNATEQRRMVDWFHTDVVGPFSIVDRQAPRAPVVGYVFDEREPTPLEWYFTSGTDRVRTIRPDAFYTWELRDTYAQTPNPPPSAEPRTVEELRIAHNIAVSDGNSALAEAYMKRLVSQLDVQVATKLTDGTRLVGERYVRGVSPTLSVYFLASGPAQVDWWLGIQSTITRKSPISIVPPDEQLKQMGRPFSLPARLWKEDYLYVATSEILHRPGVEAFRGYVGAPSPDPATPQLHAPRFAVGGDEVQLLELQ
jgi:hypothetical protein